MVATFKVVSADFGVEDRESDGGKKLLKMQNWRQAILSGDSCPDVEEELSESLEHDHTRPHEMGQSGGENKYLEALKWQILPHSPYSPDVALPTDFHLTYLAQWHTAWLTSSSARVKK
nr:Mariner Mos1 transposase [Hymenolepis microstoma]